MEEEIEAEIKGGEELQVRNEGGRDEEEEGHKSLNHNSLYYDFIQRYFTSYQTKTLYLHRHSNGLFIVRVRTDALPSKPVEIRNVLDIQEVRGKKKKGGTHVGKYSVIVEIICENGFVLPVTALLDGVILELNQKLSPALLDKPEGYVAVINPGRKFRADPAIFQQILLPHQR